jgi:hypothetical protein
MRTRSHQPDRAAGAAEGLSPYGSLVAGDLFAMALLDASITGTVAVGRVTV